MTRDTTEIAREIAYELRGDQLPWSNRGTAIMDRALLADRIAAAIEQDRAEREAWLPIETAPRDGRWLLMLCNDRATVYRVSWGRDRQGKLWWCSATGSYGDGLFCGWAPFPALPSPPSEESSS